MTIPLAPNTPLADALSAAVQPKLVEMGWSSDGEDSSPLSEYIVLMLVNGKTEDQITAELSGDLLGLGPEDESTKVFTRWLFDELERLNMQMNGGGASGSVATTGSNGGDAGQSQQEREDQQQGDEMMDEGSEGHADGIPTGPKAMRQGKSRRPGQLFNQVNKAMDRTTDPLRRVRPQGDSSRIQKHDQNNNNNNNRQRGNFAGGRGMHQQNGMGRGFQNAPNAFHQPQAQAMGMMGGPMGSAGFNPMMMTPEQQMQFFHMMEQQAKLLGAVGFPGMAPNPTFPAQQQQFGPNGQYNNFNQQAQPGRSLFERVELPPNHPDRQKVNQKNKPTFGKSAEQAEAGADSEMNDGTTPMDVNDVTESSEKAEPCKFGLSCTKVDCPFAHPSPASDPTRAVAFVGGEKCPFGVNCRNRKCTSSHPSPAGAAKPVASKPHVAPAEQDCRFWPNCTNPACPFKHPTTTASTAMPPCRNGPNCTRPNCHFTHAAIDVPCRFTPCLNPACVYKHVEGQQQGVFENKSWTPNASKKPHVSERTFVTDEDGEEELIIPGQSHGGDTDMNGSKTDTSLEVTV